ncbi:hypothetical protein A6D6_00046 [Alcanivorax xiamenensis]|uniref:DUF1365 domain-containing protein n=1 Tax=Alcanivorax xiamenensis TaxID=1177156 RepID=A0ABQ6YDC9_9GAMM|nr:MULTISPECIES: DUF1365 domain-containing protein [Alcanivorax]KAF0808337.1 hypothetical protein A6D6_00046 [Alcanivorax xiamenensis]
MIPDFALARGHVWHCRRTPVVHSFRYPLWLVWCNVDEPDRLLRRQKLWGRRWRLVTFRDRDFIDGRDRPLGEKVRQQAREHGLDWSSGRICMLGQWRTFGALFNPLVLYMHFPPGADYPSAMLAEVRNTPWHERHFYALPLAWTEQGLTASHAKTFHVSPFLPMALRYHWYLHALFPDLRLTLEDHDGDQLVFSAGLNMRMTNADPGAMARIVCRFGAQSLKTMAGIYWQAWRLWRKGVPFHAHPGRGESRGGDNGHDGRG